VPSATIGGTPLVCTAPRTVWGARPTSASQHPKWLYCAARMRGVDPVVLVVQKEKDTRGGGRGKENMSAHNFSEGEAAGAKEAPGSCAATAAPQRPCHHGHALCARRRVSARP
jgi:hypothetical protein